MQFYKASDRDQLEVEIPKWELESIKIKYRWQPLDRPIKTKIISKSTRLDALKIFPEQKIFAFYGNSVFNATMMLLKLHSWCSILGDKYVVTNILSVAFFVNTKKNIWRGFLSMVQSIKQSSSWLKFHACKVRVVVLNQSHPVHQLSTVGCKRSTLVNHWNFTFRY